MTSKLSPFKKKSLLSLFQRRGTLLSFGPSPNKSKKLHSCIKVQFSVCAFCQIFIETNNTNIRALTWSQVIRLIPVAATRFPTKSLSIVRILPFETWGNRALVNSRNFASRCWLTFICWLYWVDVAIRNFGILQFFLLIGFNFPKLRKQLPIERICTLLAVWGRNLWD